MTARQALLCGILYWLAEANVPYVTVWTLQKPLMCSWIAGCILGCPEAGALCGALLSLLYIGYRSQGSSMPADMALAGVCAAAACSAGTGPGTAVIAALPAGFAGILIWRLRLHVNARFSRQTEAAVRRGRKWSILVPAVLLPVLFSALVCIPAGALSCLAVFRVLRSMQALPAALSGILRFLEPAGMCACAAGMVISIFPLREKKTALLFPAGTAAALFCRIPVFLLVMIAGILSAFLLPFVESYLEKRNPGMQKRKSGRGYGAGPGDGFDPDLDEVYGPGPGDGFDPDLDEVYGPGDGDGFDPDLDDVNDPDSDQEAGFAPDPYRTRKADGGPGAGPDDDYEVDGGTGRGPDFTRLPSAPALAASNLLWILFVQAAYNTHLMMGQAAAAAFLPVLGELCPEDPGRQQEILLRQSAYLNTQPEMGSSLIGCMIHMEAEQGAAVLSALPAADDQSASASTAVSSDRQADARIRSVRSALMGFFGGAGDELFQCGWIPALLMISCDLVLRSGGSSAWILLYGAAAALSSAALSAVSFAVGLTGDEMRLLAILEGKRLPWLHRLRNMLLPFLKGAALGAYMQLVLIPFLFSL